MNYIIADTKYFNLMNRWLEEGRGKKIEFRFPFNEFTIKYPDDSEVFIKTIGEKYCKIYFENVEVKAKYNGVTLILDTINDKFISKNKRLRESIQKLINDIYKIILYFIAPNKVCFYSIIMDMLKVNNAKRKGDINNKCNIIDDGKNKTSKVNHVSITKTNTPSDKTFSNKNGIKLNGRWVVKGHYREYKKTGKVIWIKSYHKGQEQGEEKDRIYKI